VYSFDRARSHRKLSAVCGRLMKKTTSPMAKNAVIIPVCTVIRIIFAIASSVATKPVLRLDKLSTKVAVIITSARVAERNQTSAGQCSSGLRENNLILIIRTVVYVPPTSEIIERATIITARIFDLVNNVILDERLPHHRYVASRVKGFQNKEIQNQIFDPGCIPLECLIIVIGLDNHNAVENHVDKDAQEHRPKQ